MLKPYVAGDTLLPDGTRLDAAVVLSGSADALHADLWTREIGDRTLTTLVREAGAGVMRKQRLAAAGINESTLTAIDAVTPDVREFSPKAAAGRVSMKDRLPTFAAFGLAFTLWFMILTGAGILLNSVIEEKSNRVLEVLLSSASVPEILGGKILGVAGLAATVLAVWATAGLIALFHFAPPGLPADLGAALLSKGLLIEFAAYFVLGYLMYASIFVAVGAFCETPREAQTLVGPMMLILAIPMIFLSSAIKRPDTPLLEYLSWFPPFTPFLMTARHGVWTATLGGDRHTCDDGHHLRRRGLARRPRLPRRRPLHRQVRHPGLLQGHGQRGPVEHYERRRANTREHSQGGFDRRLFRTRAS